METKVLNYRILVEKEGTPRTKRAVYVAYCPKLGISDWGSSIDEALAHIQEAIECHIASLVKHEEDVPEVDPPRGWRGETGDTKTINEMYFEVISKQYPPR